MTHLLSQLKNFKIEDDDDDNVVVLTSVPSVPVKHRSLFDDDEDEQQQQQQHQQQQQQIQDEEFAPLPLSPTPPAKRVKNSVTTVSAEALAAPRDVMPPPPPQRPAAAAAASGARSRATANGAAGARQRGPSAATVAAAAAAAAANNNVYNMVDTNTLAAHHHHVNHVVLKSAELSTAFEPVTETPGLFTLADYTDSDTPAAHENTLAALASGYKSEEANGVTTSTPTAAPPPPPRAPTQAPSPLALQAPLEVHRSTQDRTLVGYMNYLTQSSVHAAPTAPRVDASAPGSSYGQSFLRAVIEVAPHRSRPVSDHPAIGELRKATRGVRRADIERQIATPRAGIDVPCVCDADCAGHRLRNINGELIGGSRLAVFVFPDEMPRMQNDRPAFRRELATRMCILDKLRVAQRAHANLAQSNSAADVSAGCATDFHVFVMPTEYPAEALVGPDDTVYNMMLFPLPRYSERGWERIENVSDGTTLFVNRFLPPNPVPPKWFETHRIEGF